MASSLSLVFGIVILGCLVVAVIRLVQRVRHDRAHPAPPRSGEQKDRDRRTAVIWGVALLILIGVLLGAYQLLHLPS